MTAHSILIFRGPLLGENSLKWSILTGWMDDSDANNLSTLGHRRWILNPAMSMTGFGCVTGNKGTYQAMYVYDRENRDSDYTGVCWLRAQYADQLFQSFLRMEYFCRRGTGHLRRGRFHGAFFRRKILDLQFVLRGR